MKRPRGSPGFRRGSLASLALLTALAFAAARPDAQGGHASGDTTVVAGTGGNPGRAIELTSEPAGAHVYLDGLLIGGTPLRIPIDESTAGGRGVVVLKIVGGDPGRWFVPVVTDSVAVPPAGTGPASATVVRHYDLPLPLRITSEPAGAEVLLGDSLLGTTPLLAMVPRSASRLDFRRAGYEPQSAMLRDGLSDYRVVLVPREAMGGPDPLPALQAGGGKTYTPVLIAAGSAVVAGAASAWLKNLADRSYEEYRSTGDGSTLDRVRRYDILSGISLVAAEISLGYLVIDLLSR